LFEKAAVTPVDADAQRRAQLCTEKMFILFWEQKSHDTFVRLTNPLRCDKVLMVIDLYVQLSQLLSRLFLNVA
jgi:hypothetical protein